VNTRYQELASRIRGELSELDHVVQRAQSAWRYVQNTADNQVYLDSVALNLHGLYSGLERLFELVARHVDGVTPSGENWHRDLLQRMAQEMPERRPAVVSADTARALDEYRRFRHLVRNLYTFHLVPEKLEDLLNALPRAWQNVQAELLAFAEFLEDLAHTE